MKCLIILSVFIIAYIGLSDELPNFENCPDSHPVHAKKEVHDMLSSRCVNVKCDIDGSYSQKPCGVYRCPHGKHKGYKTENQDAIYPACCGGPICE